MKFEETEVWGFKHAFRGMRNPKESWGKSDSSFGFCGENEGVEEGMAILRRDNGWCEYVQLGPDDLKLAQSLIKAGSEHRKFMRQIFVSVDITIFYGGTRHLQSWNCEE